MKSIKGIDIKEEYKILSIEGYFRRAYDIYSEMEKPSLKEAYYQVERELEKFGVQRYASYECFREMKSQYLQKEKIKNIPHPSDQLKMNI